MTGRDLAAVGFRLAGVYALIQVIRMLAPLLTMPAWSYSDDFDVNLPLLVLANLIPFVLMAYLAIHLIVKPTSWADALVRDLDQRGTSVTRVEVHVILFSVVGVLLIGWVSSSLPQAIRGVAVTLSDYTAGYEDRRADYLRENWMWLAGVGLQLVIGCALLFGAKRLVGGIRRQPRQPSATEEQCPHCGHPFSSADYRADSDKCLCSKCGHELPRKFFDEGV